MIGRPDLQQIVRGLLMGGADIIPGVSGGTVALILGIYHRLVTAISRFDLTLLKLIGSFELREAAVYVDLRFLAFLALGIATGILGLATTMHYLLENQLEYTLAAFFGMILASCFVVGRMVGGWNPLRLAGLSIGVLFAYWLVGLPFLENPPDNLGYYFLCGVIAICAMILPGISGAFILLILGKYYDVTGVLRSMTHGEFSRDGFNIVVTFSSGCVIGLLSFSKILRFLLDRARGMTMSVLAGFMLGSLRKIWPFKTDLTPGEHDFKFKQFENHWPDLSDSGPWITILILLAAAAFVMVLERVSAQRDGGA